MKCIIIAIGQELVNGEYYETNAKKIASELSLLGINILRIEIVPDEIDTLIESIKKALVEADILITTGGLGPTDDDLTRYAFSTALGIPLELNEEELNRIKAIFEKNAIKYSNDNDRQAFFPENSQIILNIKGTASGFYIDNNGKKVFSLPGVPEQAEYLFKTYVLKKLNKNTNIKIFSFTAKTQDISEARLNELFRNNVNQKNIKWGTLSKDDGIYLKVGASGKNAGQIIEKAKSEVIKTFKHKIWGWDDDYLPALTAAILKKKNLKLSIIESCTGGLLGKLLTSIPGSSSFFKGGVIAYSNEIKTGIVGVDGDIIDKHGAVSEECVTALAEKGRELFQTDYCVSISGIAGPGGGSDEKPVGTVWIGISSADKTRAYHYIMPGSRQAVRARTANYALCLLKKQIQGD